MEDNCTTTFNGMRLTADPIVKPSGSELTDEPPDSELTDEPPDSKSAAEPPDFGSVAEPTDSESTADPPDSETYAEVLDLETAVATTAIEITVDHSDETTVEPTDCESTEKLLDVPVHPYLEEIMKCPSNDWQLEKKDPVPFRLLEETPYTLVDSKELLDQMMTKLRNEKEIALAKKRSTHRSFNGMNCLIQIATRSEVFLLDTITLKEDVEVLNEIFTSSGTLKVIKSGAGVFIENIQKDLGLYMVNMFCLSLVLKTLSRMKTETEKIWKDLTLKVMLEKHCGDEFNLYSSGCPPGEQKDWRERPLTDEDIKSARLQVHYLLHIYDRSRNMLIDHNILKDVYQECNVACCAVWQAGKHNLLPTSHLLLYKQIAEGSRGQKRMAKRLNKVQVEAFRLLFEWRHLTAEKLDESKNYLLKDRDLYRIARSLPKDIEGIRASLSTLNPCSLLVEYFGTILELIDKAVDEMSDAPDAYEKVTFFPEQMERHAANKKKADATCPVCGKFGHSEQEPCKKKKRMEGKKERKKNSLKNTKCHTCGKGYHHKGQTCSTRDEQNQHHGQGTSDSGQNPSMNAMRGHPMGFIGSRCIPRGIPRGMTMDRSGPMLMGRSGGVSMGMSGGILMGRSRGVPMGMSGGRAMGMPTGIQRGITRDAPMTRGMSTGVPRGLLMPQGPHGW